MYGTTGFELVPVTDDKGIDVVGCDGIVFFARVSEGDTSATLRAEGGDSKDSATNELEGTRTQAQEGEQIIALDIYHPMDRFVRPILDGGNGELFALKYGGRTQKGSQSKGFNRVAAPIHAEK
jgi:hypothetical protein